ncbi:tripeptidyl-peptidase-like protein [Myriangium duriaei CBS 260.36]|uniref:tripeptidyl-peptidase II n=1 Tax=Myriangium duriaei CBS 260.36 TaxID=1168546 RepID=A0A9P4JC07_9PEZI|nr:tripeptidyl-peptidase-like protein [Myriangium duriaei CBS 260.36]
MLFAGTTLVAALAGLASLAEGKVMESLHGVPQGWQAVRKPAAETKLMFRIAMNQPAEGLVEQMLFDISTPGHAKYGQHLKRDELKELLRPNPQATSAVIAWLKESGISAEHIVDDGEWINFWTDVAGAEKMLDTKFQIYGAKQKDLEKIRTLQYSVPEELHKYIDMIQPTTRFGQLQAQTSQVHDVHILGDASSANVAAVNATCNSTVTPDCLRSLYHVTEVPGLNPKKVGHMGINGFLEEYARYNDFEQFTSLYAPYLAHSNFTYQLINGGKNDQASANDSVEANLDAQYALALSYPVNATYFSTGGRGPIIPDLDQPVAAAAQNEPYLDFLNYILGQPDDKLPHTLTTSYGEDEQSVPESYNRRVCSMFGQLGARGVSVLFSSGDTGPGSACQSNDGKNTTKFNPIFPASCITVTSVGGTVGVNPERAVSFSSGGFSERFSRPSYQDAAVKGYLKQIGDTFKGLYNPHGRGFPDVAAQGRGFQVVDKGKVVNVGGTSASSPTFAGIVALLNAARLSNGQRPLGFLNPWLYSDGKLGLTDIVDGGSKGCTGKDIYSGLASPLVIGAGWNATKGWDPVTGLGTPLFDRLLTQVTQKGYGYGGGYGGGYQA